MSAYRTIRYDRQGHIGRLTLARPNKRNAQNPLMWEELTSLGVEVIGDEALRCLVVSGEGPTFSAGIDLVEGLGDLLAGLAGRPLDEDTVSRGMKVAGTFRWITELGCATVAAVRGHAYGAGLQLALACDFRIFAEGTKVGLLESRYGILPDMGATIRLPRIVGDGRARELILLGEIIDAADAWRIGLANQVVAESDLDASVTHLADRSSLPTLVLCVFPLDPGSDDVVRATVVGCTAKLDRPGWGRRRTRGRSAGNPFRCIGRRQFGYRQRRRCEFGWSPAVANLQGVTSNRSKGHDPREGSLNREVRVIQNGYQPQQPAT